MLLARSGKEYGTNEDVICLALDLYAKLFAASLARVGSFLGRFTRSVISVFLTGIFSTTRLAIPVEPLTT